MPLLLFLFGGFRRFLLLLPQFRYLRLHHLDFFIADVQVQGRVLREN